MAACGATWVARLSMHTRRTFSGDSLPLICALIVGTETTIEER